MAEQAEGLKKTKRGQKSKPETSLRLEKIKGRDVTIDNIKGILVLIFVFIHTMRNINKSFALPEWLFYHSNPVFFKWWGFNWLDLGPIAFYFLIGFVVYAAFEKRRAVEGKAAYKNYFLKNIALVGIMLCLFYIQANALGGSPTQWDYITGIGFTGVLLIPFLHPFISKHTWAKFAAAALVFAFYFFAHDILFKFLAPPLSAGSQQALTDGNLFSVDFYGGSGGGMAASFGFVGVILLVAGIADLAKKKLWYYAVATAVLYLVGILCTKVFTPHYQLLDIPYMIGALSKFNLIFFVFKLFNVYVLKGKAIPLVATIGRNLLLFMLVTLLIIAFIGLLPKAGVAVAIIEAIVVIGLYFGLAALLSKKKTLFKL
ncbi:MAG: hypothetical protein LBT20_04385 [Clostridiales bacterium]|jgi:hypothetical protein|nr:hypothetical protein [Clostridiales bacterium]